MKKFGIAIIGIILSLLGINAGVQTFGSVENGSEYQATSTRAMFSNGPGVRTQRVLVSNGPAILGSIVIASTSASTFTVWDATSTTDTASSSLMTITASPTKDFVIDAALYRGLIIDMPSTFNGDYVITFKQR